MGFFWVGLFYQRRVGVVRQIKPATFNAAAIGFKFQDFHLAESLLVGWIRFVEHREQLPILAQRMSLFHMLHQCLFHNAFNQVGGKHNIGVGEEGIGFADAGVAHEYVAHQLFCFPRVGFDARILRSGAAQKHSHRQIVERIEGILILTPIGAHHRFEFLLFCPSGFVIAFAQERKHALHLFGVGGSFVFTKVCRLCGSSRKREAFPYGHTQHAKEGNMENRFEFH